MGEGHRARMTARFLKSGFDDFEDHEIIEYMLFYALPRVNTNEIAHRLLKKFGSLHGVLEASETDIASVKGMGEKSAAFLTMFPGLLRAYKKSKLGKKPGIKSIKHACECCVALLFGKAYEEFYVIWLNTQNRMIHSEKISEGGIKESPIYMDKVAASGLRHRAVKAIITHNHPGGNLTPSVSDLTTTETILRALALINIELVDHIIVSDDKTFSFQADSLMGKRDLEHKEAYAAEYTGVKQFVAVLAEEMSKR